MLCVLVLILTKYMVQCGMLFVNNFVFKHVNLHTKNKHTLLNIENHRICPIKAIMEIRQFSRLTAKYTRAQTVFMIAADLYMFW